MSKLGVGVGEEFPAGEPPANLPDPEPRRRRFWWPFALHVLVRLAFVALVIGLIAFAFHGFGAPYAYGPYAGWHGHFFFPFFPLLLLVFLIFALRRHHYCGYGHRMWRWQDDMRRWHDEMHRDRGERV